MTSHEYKDMIFSPDDFAHLKIPLENLLSATNNFAEENVDGRGIVGNLYKGQILLSGELIDIRAQRLNKDLQDRDEQFWMEISMLSSLKHKNLVSLVGFCDENDEKIFIYKSEMRGSLDNHLSDSMRLTWVRRLQISVTLAKALSYIHYDELRDFSVIHRKINSGTVLLNDNWESKLYGFERSMKIKASERHHSFHTNKLQYVNGYVDPTYIDTKSVNHKSDIYSFGIVLFELVCGRVYYKDLAPLAIALYRDKKLISIINPELLKQMDLHSFNMFAEIAYECLDNERSRRPNINDIVPRLEKALELQLKPGNHDKNSIAEGTSSSIHEKLMLQDNYSIVEGASSSIEKEGSKCGTFYWLDPKLPNDYYKQEVFKLIQMEKRLKEDKCSLNGKIRDLEGEINFQKSTLEKELLMLQLELKESNSNLVFYKKIVVVMCVVIAILFISIM